MFPKRSIKNHFILQILVASAAMILIFSSILYVYIQQSIFDERKQELITLAKNVSHDTALNNQAFLNEDSTLGVKIELVHINNKTIPLVLGEKSVGKEHFLVLYFPYELKTNTYIRIIKEFTATKKMLNRILNSIFIINAISFLFIIFYAYAFANLLIAPITALTEKLANMNENFINPIELKTLPIEFLPLGESVNILINRIQTFIKYQKELFIGAAHELKTPLAVMKLKNDVTLIKRREPEAYIDALKTNNEAINSMNSIVSDILNVGRQEGAHFEAPKEIDVIAFLQKKCHDFQLLAKHDDKEIVLDLSPQSYTVVTQVTLVNQIVQNFIQNALKFTPKGKRVYVSSKEVHEGLEITVIDEGCGIDEHMDVFAPFKRSGNKSGVGLGLFLAKSAADALNATISISNRKDDQGAIATLTLKSTLSCLLPKRLKKK